MDFLRDQQRVGDAVVRVNEVFRFPQRLRTGRAEAGDGRGGRSVVVRREHADEIGSGGVRHRVGGEVPFPIRVLGQNDLSRSHITGRQRSGKIRHEVMDLLSAPEARFVSGAVVRFVLHRHAVKIHAVSILHCRNVVGQLTRIALKIRRRRNEGTAVHGVGVFENGWRTPRRAPDARTTRRSLLRDGSFRVVNDAAGRDARAQQRKPHAGVRGKKQVGIRCGERTKKPRRRRPEAVNALLSVGEIDDRRAAAGVAGELQIIHP